MTDTDTSVRIHNNLKKSEPDFKKLVGLCSRMGISRNSRAFHMFENRARPKPTAGAFGKKTK